MSLKSVQEQIKRNGKLPGGKRYLQLSESVFGKITSVEGKSDTAVGQPDGFGKGFTWDRKEDPIFLGLFINAADPLGVSVSGLQPNDQIQVTSVAGIASFSKDDGNPLASSLVALAATGAQAIAMAEGASAAVPFIEAGEQFAKEQFKPTNAKTKRRDAFGRDPGSGHKARQEGGILISLPRAGGPYYSGNEDHKERWIKEHGDRVDSIRPDHVKHAFFPVRGNDIHNTRKVSRAGQLYVTPWDHIFDDNAGFYKVFVLISKESPGGVVVN